MQIYKSESSSINNPIETRLMRYNRGTVIAALVVLVYVGFEGYAIHKVRDRTKPDYIHNVLIQAKTATEACNSDRLIYRERFERTLARVENNYREMLRETDPEATEAIISQQLVSQTAKSVAEAENELIVMNCNSQTIKNHFQRYRLYARKSR